MNNNAYECLNLDGGAPLLLICDHASNRVPPELDNLGLTLEQLNQHIGWDIGAADIARALSRLMDAPAVLCSTSRLVIDVNRAPGDASRIPQISDQIVIPGNQNLTEADKIGRAEKYFCPYHHAIAETLTYLRRPGEPSRNIPAIFSIHTFTPSMPSKNGSKRPWHAGVLWNRDPRIAEPLIRLLQNHSDNLIIGNNEPYSGKEIYYSVDCHASSSGFPHCAIEVRQDLVETLEGAFYWAKIIAEILKNILATPELNQIKYY